MPFRTVCEYTKYIVMLMVALSVSILAMGAMNAQIGAVKGSSDKERQLLGSGQMPHEAEQRRGRLRQDQVHDQ